MIISFFGDAIVPRGGCVSARTVQTVMQRLAVDAGAVRTALSRLATDGWVVRHKEGRFSFYHLSDTGYEPFKQAALRIYAPPSSMIDIESNADERSWRAVFVDPNSDLDITALASQLPATVMTPNCLLFEDPDQPTLDCLHSKLAQGDCLTLSGRLSEVPDWLKANNADAELARQYRRLISDFSPFEHSGTMSPLDALAARCLLIHEWRRVLLRSPVVDPRFVPDDWPMSQCHELVARLYWQVSPAAERWLEQNAARANDCDTLPRESTAERFR